MLWLLTVVQRQCRVINKCNVNWLINPSWQLMAHAMINVRDDPTYHQAYAMVVCCERNNVFIKFCTQSLKVSKVEFILSKNNSPSHNKVINHNLLISAFTFFTIADS